MTNYQLKYTNALNVPFQNTRNCNAEFIASENLLESPVVKFGGIIPVKNYGHKVDVILSYENKYRRIYSGQCTADFAGSLAWTASRFI